MHQEQSPTLGFSRRSRSVALCCSWIALALADCSQDVEPAPVQVAKAEQPLFANGDFESGPNGQVPTNWTLTTYLNPAVTRTTPQLRSGLNLQGGGIARTTARYTAAGAESQPDGSLGTSGSIRWPKYGNFATAVNYQGASRNVNSLTQTMTLSVNDVDPYDGKLHIRFAVAPVLQSGGHIPEQQPYYFVQVTNTSTNTVLYVDYNASAEVGIPWKQVGQIYYTDWQLKDIVPTSIQAAIGDTIELEVLAAGCSQSGHFGHVWVDGVGATVPGLSVTGTAPSSANADTDLVYTLNYGNGGTATAGNVTIDFTLPTSTTFQSVTPPTGALCTQPSVGGTGTVSCVFGLLDPGTNGSMQITAHIDSGATGTITAGTYQISANNATPLLGSKIQTSITSAVLTDVSVSNTNNVGAVNWGSQTTYTVVVTNNGPNTVTNGTLANPIPTNVTGLNWTCSGAGGGTCPASGSGAINAAVSLPVNGSVTFSVVADIVAGSGVDKLVDTATFTLPGGMSDSQPNDNAYADSDWIESIWQLTINKAGNATGNVVSVPNAISCGTSCNSQSANFGQTSTNNQVVLAATPAAGELFTGWSGGGCSGTGNCSLTLSADTVVTATFDSPPPCAVDSDCSATRYCDGNSLTCQPRLPNGSPIPNDLIHDGTCTNFGSACVSMRCNADKCAKPGGTSCSAASECYSNTCTNSVCATKANGSDCVGNQDCSSNSCKSNHCVPAANGCYVDGDCSNSQYCNRSTLTCATKLTSGTAIPNDGLHGGTCSDAGAVCQTGQCNTSTQSCAGANGATCSGAAGCVNNTCTSLHCVPSSNGCWVDGDCASGDYCDRSTLTCSAKLGPGTAMPNDGLHDGTCSMASSVCTSGECNSTTNTCASATSADCTNANECVSNTCTSLHCVPSVQGCFIDSDCSNDRYCDRSTLTCALKLLAGTAIPNDGLHGGTCSDAGAVCATTGCNTGSNTCASENGIACNAQDQCVTNTCTSGHCVPDTAGCYIDGDCATSEYCDRSAFTCTAQLGTGAMLPAADGYHAGTCVDAAALCQSGLCNSAQTTCALATTSTCATNADCTVNVCDTNMKCGTKDGGAGCTSGNAATFCQSGTCAASGRCVPAGGDGCYIDSDCDSGEYCERSSLSCKTKLANGQPIPNDGLHDGRCTQPNAQATCASSGCNAATNTCASNNGTSCTVPNECVRNICGSNGKCGHPDGEGPCTQANAKFVCQSATCSLNGNVCVPPLNHSCAADSDCPLSAYCDALNSICVADLANGQPLPSDALHNGQCDVVLGQTVCASSSCNPSTQQCAGRLGDNCAVAADCAKGVCGSNMKCGLAVGQGTCTLANQAQTCQSGLCSQDGTCIQSGTCRVDSDCVPDWFCDRSGSVATCVTRLPAGSPIPSDGYHDGTCPNSGLTAVCASGRCSIASDLCVVPNGTSCTAPEQCDSGVCGSNSLCGVADGDGPCMAGGPDPICQSGVCAGGGTCLPSGGCTLDSDCSSAGGFCSNGLCLPTLPAGTPIPNDPEHAGACDPTIGAAVCASGLCNQSSDTCAAATGGSCAVPAQCVSNVCGPNGQCGLPNGSGPCTVGDQAVTCQSGSCSPNSLTCIAPGGCGDDDDCGSLFYCDGGSYTCAMVLSDGTPLPNDGLHDGTCNNANARACSSAACNPTSDSCAAQNGANCVSAADCATNLCAGDGKCGAEDGSGHCTPAEPQICRSGVCSTSTLTCIPASGCSGDNDCSAAQYCDTSMFSCNARLSNGDPLPPTVSGGNCPNSGVTRVCYSGLCNPDTDTCAGSNGDSCSGASECQSNVCGSNSRCGLADGDVCDPESDAALCQSGNCGDSGTCEPALNCTADVDCAPSGYCDGIICQLKLRAGLSIADDGLHDGLCTQANAGAICVSGSCNDTTDTCSGPFNAACADASACVANVCGDDGRCGLDVGDGGCTNLNASIVCRTGLCSAVGVCLPNQTSGCAVDSDCGSGTFCDLTQYVCVSKLADGFSIPNDGLHDGICSDESAAAVCASGACNPITDTCARPNGTNCSSASTCVYNVCGSNEQCGIAEGDASCTPETQAVCQTGRCSLTAGRCIVTEQGCAADVDCGETRYCDPAALRCVTKRAAGAALPMDALHGGSCNASIANAVCQTRACNAVTKTCAAANGTSCAGAAECRSNFCGNNERCGLAVGESGCSPDSGVNDCQSAFCAPSGVCAPPQGCDVDSDCQEGTYCNHAAHVCAAKLESGEDLPSDGLHEPTCTAELAAAVCVGGVCNAATKTCASVAGAPCTAVEQCAADICDDNAMCGYASGHGPCSAGAQCQSGQCDSATSKCVASESGCTTDADCPAEAHCDLSKYTCAADLADGVSLPSASPSGGRCTSAIGSAYCASGVCNPQTDRCAKAGGSECESDSECAFNSCSNGKCGSADGTGECTSENAVSACQSRRCQTDLGRCIAAVDGCGSDQDCGDDEYCNGKTLACVAKMASGAKLPADEMHGTECTGEVAMAVCMSRMCNAVVDKCAEKDGSACETAADCGSNACLRGVCVPTSSAPPVAKLSGGRCSVALVQAGRAGPSLGMLLILALLLRRRGRQKRGPGA